MKRPRLHVVAWISLLVALGLLFWPLQPDVSLLELPGAFGGGSRGFPTSPGNALDALFGSGNLGGAALWRLSCAMVLLGLTIGIELAVRHSSADEAAVARPSMSDLARFSGP